MNFSKDFPKVRSANLIGRNGAVHIGGIRFERGTTQVEANRAVESMEELLEQRLTAARKVVAKREQDMKKKKEARELLQEYSVPKKSLVLGDFF